MVARGIRGVCGVVASALIVMCSDSVCPGFPCCYNAYRIVSNLSVVENGWSSCSKSNSEVNLERVLVSNSCLIIFCSLCVFVDRILNYSPDLDRGKIRESLKKHSSCGAPNPL